MRNWRESIQTAQEMGITKETTNSFSREFRQDHERFHAAMVSDVGDFSTCAIGERKEKFEAVGIPFNVWGSPTETDWRAINLFDLGLSLCTLVIDCHWSRALEILDKMDSYLVETV